MAADIASFSVTVLPERIVTVKSGIEFLVWRVGGGLFVRGVDGHRRRGGCGPRCSRRGEQGADIRGENRPMSYAAKPPTSPEDDSSAAFLHLPGQPASAASLLNTSVRPATASSLSRGGLPPSVSIGSENAGASTTSAPAIPNDLRALSFPDIPPYWPMEAPTIASGSAAIAFCTGGARQPVDRILESAGSAAVVLRCHQQDRVGFSDGRRAAC